MKKKVFLVPVFFLLGLFLFSKPAFAQTCVCSIGSITNPNPNVTSNSCPANSVATCSVSGGSIYNMQAHCNCVVSDPNPYAATTSITRNANSGANPLCGNDTGINTAIGCIHALGDESAFLSDLLRWATGVGGGIAFLLMLYAGFMIMTASGNPERLKAGQELLTSAISGLILLIFSVFILKFIGIDILKLCKFGFGAPCTD